MTPLGPQSNFVGLDVEGAFGTPPSIARANQIMIQTGSTDYK